MARYIDADALLSKMPDDLPYKSSVKRVLMQATAADVVPKSEVDKYKKAVQIAEDEYKKILNHYLFDTENGNRTPLQRARAEVAREIFAEIERVLTDNEVYFRQTDKMRKDFAELKKKYTEVTKNE